MKALFLPSEPTEAQVQEFIKRTRDLPLTYEEHGASRNEARIKGFIVDHNRAELGKGKQSFDAACEAIRKWEMFNFSWIKLYPESQRIEPGVIVAVCANLRIVWALNACRIVYVIDEPGAAVSRFGFAYGTLPPHLERGEERFMIEWDHTTDSVTYDLFAFSRPQHPLAQLGYPVTRFGQRQFILASQKAMRRAMRAYLSAQSS